MKMIHQFMLAIFLPTFLVCLFITGFTGLSLTKHIERTTTHALEEQVNRYATEVERQLEFLSHGADVQKKYIEQTLNFESFKTDLGYREDYLENLIQFITTIAQQEPFQGSYSVTFVPQFTDSVIQTGIQDFDDNGSLEPLPQLSISYFTTETSDPSKDWYFKPLKTGDQVWTGPYTKKNGLLHHQYMTISSPIFYNKQIIGVACTDYDFDAFTRLVQQFQYQTTGYAAISDLNHRFILHPVYQEAYLNEIDNGKYRFITEKVDAYDSGIIEYQWLNNESKVLAFKHLQNSWTLYLTASQAEVLLSIGPFMWVTYGLFALAITLSFLAAWLLGKWTTAPILDLISNVTNDLAPKTPQNFDSTRLNRHDEIHDLAKSIDTLRNSQADLAIAIEDYNQNLSFKVDDRNKDLIALNQNLNDTRATLEIQQYELRQKNKALEESIEEIMSVQKQLIHSDKIAAFGYIVTGIAEEVDIPVEHSTALVSQMSSLTDLVHKSLLELEPQEALIRESSLQIEAIDQELLRNLYFTKDIIDYIKDIVKSKSQHRSLPVVLKEAILNSANSAISLTNIKNVKLVVHCPDQLAIQSDPGLFSHILFSIFTTILQEALLKDYDYFVTAKVFPDEEQLKIVIYDNAATHTPKQASPSTLVPLDDGIGEINMLNPGQNKTRHLKMGFNMIYILMTEFFKGDFKVSQQYNSNGYGNCYTLIFYDITYM